MVHKRYRGSDGGKVGVVEVKSGIGCGCWPEPVMVVIKCVVVVTVEKVGVKEVARW